MTDGRALFVMPRFSRTMWVSDQAREAWEWRITAFAESWRQMEWLTVADKVRPCASFWLSQQELAALGRLLAGYGLKVVPLLWRTQDATNQAPLRYRVAVGSPGDLRHFRKAWKRGDDDAIGRLLGYPACCRAFFHKVFVEDGLADSIWPMGVRTLSNTAEARVLEVNGPPELNPFWREAGVRLTPHDPCRFDCGEALGLAQAFCDSGREFGCGKNIEQRTGDVPVAGGMVGAAWDRRDTDADPQDGAEHRYDGVQTRPAPAG